MRSLVVLACFAAVAFSLNVCFPEEFKMDQVTYSPEQNDFYNARIWFSVKLNQQRMDFNEIIVDGQPLKEKLSFYFDYNNGYWWEVTYTNASFISCVAHPNMTGSLTQRCLSKNAKHRGTALLGGVLTVDNYVEKLSYNNTVVKADILADYNLNVPIRADFRSASGYSRDEYWNFVEHVKAEDFYIPAECNLTPKMGKAASFMEMLAHKHGRAPGFYQILNA